MSALGHIPSWFAKPLILGKLGVTGSRLGPTKPQEFTFGRITLALMEHACLTHGVHGDCFGVDRFSHVLWRALGMHVDIYPPTDESMRAFCDGPPEFVTIHPAMPYLERNEIGVAGNSSSLIAMPRGSSRGTWHCLDCATKQGKPAAIINPDGTTIWRQP